MARVSDEIKKLVFADPSMDPKRIVLELSKRGVKTSESTAASYRSDFLASLEVLRGLGVLGSGPAPVANSVAAAPEAARPADAVAPSSSLVVRSDVPNRNYEISVGLADGTTRVIVAQARNPLSAIGAAAHMPSRTWSAEDLGSIQSVTWKVL